MYSRQHGIPRRISSMVLFSNNYPMPKLLPTCVFSKIRKFPQFQIMCYVTQFISLAALGCKRILLKSRMSKMPTLEYKKLMMNLNNYIVIVIQYNNKSKCQMLYSIHESYHNCQYLKNLSRSPLLTIGTSQHSLFNYVISTMMSYFIVYLLICIPCYLIPLFQ